MGSENAPEFVQKIQFSIEYKNELNVVGDLQNLITTDFEITSLSTSEVRNTFKTSQKIKILVRILMIFQSQKRLYNHKCPLVTPSPKLPSLSESSFQHHHHLHPSPFIIQPSTLNPQPYPSTLNLQPCCNVVQLSSVLNPVS